MRRLRRKAPVFAHTGRSRLGRRRLEDHLVNLETERVDGFVDVIAVAVADDLEVCRGHAHKQRTAFHVRKPGGLEPRLKALPFYLLFQRTEDAHPLIQNGG